MQVREGYILFRVNGGNRITVYYRVILVAANVVFGALAGGGAALDNQPMTALAQCASILGLQLLLALLCLCCSPDADRVISASSGTQYLVEGASTGLIFFADLIVELKARWKARVRERVEQGLEDNSQFHVSDEMIHNLRVIAFWTALFAVIVPILQLLEQRFITPTVLLLRTKKANKTALLASAYMLATSLPRLIESLFTRAEQKDTFTSGQTTAQASADSAEEGFEESAVGDQAQGEISLSGGDAYLMGDKVTKLLARSMAAKEAAAKEVGLNAVRASEQSTYSPRHHHRRSGIERSDSMSGARRTSRFGLLGRSRSSSRASKSRDLQKMESNNDRMLDQIKEQNEVGQDDFGGGD